LQRVWVPAFGSIVLMRSAAVSAGYVTAVLYGSWASFRRHYVKVPSEQLPCCVRDPGRRLAGDCAPTASRVKTLRQGGALNRFEIALGLSLLLSQTASLCGLWLGRRLLGNEGLRRLGSKAHARKMRGLETTWPLTLVRPAMERGRATTVFIVIAGLIVLKSAVSLVFGILTVVTLPLTSVIVPSVAAAEDPGDAGLLSEVQTIAGLQVTSHVAAAALGFAITVAGPISDLSVGGVIRENVGWVTLLSCVSAVFAFVAGQRESAMLMRRGI
jgi:hypothetical protein